MQSKRLIQAALVAAAMGAVSSNTRAQSYTWVTPTNASFSVGPWSPATPSWGGASNSYAITFTNFTAAPYTATNDLGAPFTFGNLSFSGADGRSITLNNAVGNELSIFNNVGNGAAILAGTNVNATIAGRMNVGGSTAVGGGGTLNLTGVVTGAGGFRFGSNNVLVSGANQNTGTSSLTGGTLSIANNFALGSGTFTVSAGTLRNPNPGSTLPNIVTLNTPILISGTLTYNAPALADLALNASVSQTGSSNIVVSGAGALRLNNPFNSFNSVTLNSGTTAFDSRLIFSGTLGSGSVNFAGPGGGELVFNGLSGNTGTLNVGSTSTAFIAPSADISSLSIGKMTGAGTIVLGLFSNAGTISIPFLGHTNTGPLSFFSGVTNVNGTLGSPSTLLFDGGAIYTSLGTTFSPPVVLTDYTAINTGTINSFTNSSTLSSGVQLDPAAINDALMKNGAGFLNLNGNNTARFIVNGGSLNLSSGSITYSGSAPVLTINSSGTFSMSGGNKLPDNGSILMAGGSLYVDSAFTETAGTLALSGATASTITFNATGAKHGVFTFAGLSRPSGAALLIDAAAMGTTNQILFSIAPAGSLLAGAGGAAGSPTISLLRGVFTNDGNSTFNFATYDATIGVRSLTAAEFATTITSGSTVLNNVNLANPTVLTSATTINSLTGSGGLSGNTTLTINSGILLSAGNVGVATLNLGDGFVNGGSISSVITGTSLLTAGSVMLAGANVYTGPTVIGSGTLINGASDVIPDGSPVFVDSGSTWKLNGFNETVTSIGQHGAPHVGFVAGNISVPSGSLTIGANNGSSDFAGSISGAGRVTKIGTGWLNLSGSSSFSGGILVQQGVLRPEALAVATSPTGDPNDFAGAVLSSNSADDILGTGSIQLSPPAGNTAELRLGRNITSLSRTLFVGGYGTMILSSDTDPQRGTAAASGPTISGSVVLQSNLQLSLSSGTLNGNITGTGSLIVSSLGSGQPLPFVTLSSSNGFLGATTVKSGSLYIGSSVAASGNSPLGAGSQSLQLGTSQSDTYAELSGLDNATIARPIVTSIGLAGETLALGARTSGNVSYTGTITLAAAPLRVFAAPSSSNPVSFGSLSLTGKITGAGSLTIGGGFAQSNVTLSSTLSDYTGGTTLTDGTLNIGASTLPIPATPGTGPLGFGSLNIAGTTLPPTLVAINGSQSILNPVFLNSDVNVAGSSTLTINTLNLGAAERVVTVNSGANFAINGVVSGAGALSKDGSGTMILQSSNSYTGPTSVFAGNLQFAASQNLSSLNIGGGARAAVTAGGDKVLRAGAINIAATGTLDLADNDAIVDYTGATPIANIQRLIASGYNAGSWNGAGITSASAQTVADNLDPHRTAIGFAEASSLGLTTFDGQSVDSSSIVLRYTYSGDANLDGTVNALDFNALATNFGASNPGWSQGDFNYDGQVNTQDFTFIAANFNQAQTSPAAALASLVPEPSLLALAAIAPFISRRRVQRR